MPDPTLCTLCPHPKHQGRCKMRGGPGVVLKQQCSCPGPSEKPCPRPKCPGKLMCDEENCPLAASESAERPELVAVELPCPPATTREEFQQLLAYAGVDAFGCRWEGDRPMIHVRLKRIPSPDEPPCPISAQRVRDIAGWVPRSWIPIAHHEAYENCRKDLDTLAAYLERKGS